MNTHLTDDIATLRTRINDLIDRGTTPNILADTHQDWIAIKQDVELICASVLSAGPETAHAVLDELREMISLLNTIENSTKTP